MLYNQTKTSCGTVMPLLMGCTKPQPIGTTPDIPYVYDPISQSVNFNYLMPFVHTKTRVGRTGTCLNNRDDKLGWDDKKYVH